MAQNIFNLYSAKMFADHPLALWNLDDNFSFLSLINASAIWTIVGGSSASVAVGPKIKPGETVGVSDSDFFIETFAGSTSTMTMKSQTFNSPGNLDLNKNTVCVSTFIYPYQNEISNCEIGFEYTDPTTSQLVKNYKIFSNIAVENWTKLQHSADLTLWPASASNVVISPYLKINFINGASSRQFSLYNFAVGQWSEEFNAETSGSVPVPLSSLSASPGIVKSIGGIYSSSPSYFKTIDLDSYGVSDSDSGYYIVEGNRMLARNTKLPMVYGSGNITEIYPSSYGTPSIIFPGKGFLHENGKYKNLTLEFWLRVNTKSKEKIRIMGPINSNDGLYIHDCYLTLIIGPYEKSYRIPKWYRPSIINISYTPTYISMMINGEVVISMNIQPRDIEFPSSTLYNNDWLAFYATEDTQPFEIDCVVIYPYNIPDQLAKKKFVYAQGVGKSDEIVRKFGGNLTNIDFAFANYTNSLIYPDTLQWSSGFYSNVLVNSKYISLPTYGLPDIQYDEQSIFNIERSKRTWFGVSFGTWRQWLNTTWRKLALSREADPLYDSFFTQNDNPVKHIMLRPNGSYNNTYGSIVFNSVNMISEPVKSIFGVFSINQGELNNAINDENIKELTLMHFKSGRNIFTIYIDKVTGKLTYRFNSTILVEYQLPITGDDLFFIAGVNFNDISIAYANVLRTFFKNIESLELSVGGNGKNMFTGKIYKVNFNNKFFTENDTKNWFSNGVATINNNVTTTSNSEIVNYIANYSLLFSKTNNTMLMDIGSKGYWEDSIPLSYFASYVRDIKGSPTLYDLDAIQFNIDYSNSLYSNDVIDTSDDSIVTYVTLKTYEDVSSVNYSNYTTTKPLSNERVVNFETVQSNIDVTKFEIVDGTFIFAPKSIIDFNDAYITLHMEIKTNGGVAQPMIIREMSLASLAFDESRLFSINSINGNKTYPFSRQTSTYIAKQKNPFIIYKNSMPYLFLSGESGIYTLPYSYIDDSVNSFFYRGITNPVNPNKLSNYNLYGFHLWSCYKSSSSFTSRKRIMGILNSNTKIVFYLEPIDNGKRAKISVYEIKPYGEIEYTNVLMYQNGILLDSPYIYPLSWSLLTFSFPNPLNFNSYTGQIEIYEGLMFNNLTVYEQDISNKVDDIFELHLGLSDIVAQDESTLYINSESVSLYTDIKWTTFVGKLV